MTQFSVTERLTTVNICFLQIRKKNIYYPNTNLFTISVILLNTYTHKYVAHYVGKVLNRIEMGQVE